MKTQHTSFTRAVILCLTIIAATCMQLGHISNAAALEVPALQGPVNDYGGLISSSTRAQLEQSLKYIEGTDSTQIVILTIPSLEGESLEEFSLKAAETWQIGQAGLDNGALLLVAVKERKVRIEVGYGLEGSLTDLLAGRIISHIILPRFKEGNFNQGIIDGVTAMSKAVKGEFSAEQQPVAEQDEGPASIFAMLLFFFFFVGNLLRQNKLASIIVCGIGAPVLGTVINGYSLPLIVGLIPVGIIGGFIMSKLLALSGRNHQSFPLIGSTGGFGGGSSGGFGGFSGGGGGFGGGGASGGW
jgi:uncharacterized protein